jgi:hypothetical protein
MPNRRFLLRHSHRHRSTREEARLTPAKKSAPTYCTPVGAIISPLDTEFEPAATDPDDFAMISAAGVSLFGKGQTRIMLSASGPDSPSLEVADSQGYATQLGVSKLQNFATGRMQNTSAASLILLDKDRNVIWSAPVDH